MSLKLPQLDPKQIKQSKTMASNQRRLSDQAINRTKLAMIKENKMASNSAQHLFINSSLNSPMKPQRDLQVPLDQQSSPSQHKRSSKGEKIQELEDQIRQMKSKHMTELDQMQEQEKKYQDKIAQLENKVNEQSQTISRLEMQLKMNMGEQAALKILKGAFNGLQKKQEELRNLNEQQQDFIPVIGCLPIRRSIRFEFMPRSWQFVNRIQYPSQDVLLKTDIMKSSPFKFGMYQNSLVAKFGTDRSVREFRTGTLSDHNSCSYKVTFTHFPKENRVHKIIFKSMDCKLSKMLTNDTIYTKFNLFFLDKNSQPIGGFKNIGEFVDLKALRRQKNIQLRFEAERTQEFVLNDNELIVGMDLGVDNQGNVVDIRFILASLMN